MPTYPKLKNPTKNSWTCAVCQRSYGRRSTLKTHLFEVHKAQYVALDPASRLGYAVDKPPEEEFSGRTWDNYWKGRKGPRNA